MYRRRRRLARFCFWADISTPAERSRSMRMVGTAFGIGFSLGSSTVVQRAFNPPVFSQVVQ
jgi:hypothetical protein